MHVGCIPTKALLHIAEMYDQALHSSEIGISHQGLKLDYASMKKRKRRCRLQAHQRHRAAVQEKQESSGSAVSASCWAKAKLKSPSPGGKKEFSAKNIILATGSEARMLPNLQIDPKRILDQHRDPRSMDSVPKSLAIIGAGAVGVEFASIFRRSGRKSRSSKCCRAWCPSKTKRSRRNWREPSASAAFSRSGRESGQGQRRPKGVDIEFTCSEGKPQKLAAEKLLVAVGRTPNTKNIGLENTRSKPTASFIKVDGIDAAPAEPGVYAIGDIVAGTPQLAHVASMEGFVAVGKIAGKHVRADQLPAESRRDLLRAANRRRRPHRSAGQAKGLRGQDRQVPVRGQQQGTILGQHGGFVKVVADEKYGEILGVHIIGPRPPS